MAKQERTYTGAKTELKVSKGKFPQPYIHKIFDVTLTDDDFVKTHTNDSGQEFALRQPSGVGKIRSVFMFTTNRKNTLSVMVVYLTPMYNNKGRLIATSHRQVVRVNPITGKVWTFSGNRSANPDAPFGWSKDDWYKAIVEAVAS